MHSQNTRRGSAECAAMLAPTRGFLSFREDSASLTDGVSCCSTFAEGVIPGSQKGILSAFLTVKGSVLSQRVHNAGTYSSFKTWRASVPAHGKACAQVFSKSCLLISFFFWLQWIFAAVHGLSSCSSGEQGLLCLVVWGLLIAAASLIVEHGLQSTGSALWCMGLVVQGPAGSSQTRHQTRIPLLQADS